MKDLSIIIPAYNEEENIVNVAREINKALADAKFTFEIVFVDDGSTDRTGEEMKRAQKIHSDIVIVRHRKNRGKTDALLSGYQHANGKAIALFDADLQYNPGDLKRLYNKMESGYDIVTGWKQGKYSKQFVSRIYNILSRKLFSLPIHDQNSIKVFKTEILERVNLRKDWHRFLVALAVHEGFSVSEIKVTLYPRRAGKTKYGGKGRIIVGIFDLLSVKFQISFLRKPMLIFGITGSVFILLGIVTGLIALFLRYVLYQGFRPLLYLVILFILSGLLLLSMGFIGETLASINERIARVEKKIPRRNTSAQEGESSSEEKNS
ncbi:MAG: glycosyltransferase family 2 protein [Candidatus Cloacimonadota bacterium]|nr:MAG: glycosyltransferase family 2 protein [Candidatus Cloacimonadota bacterium]